MFGSKMKGLALLSGFSEWREVALCCLKRTDLVPCQESWLSLPVWVRTRWSPLYALTVFILTLSCFNWSTSLPSALVHVLLTPAPWAGQSESFLSVFVTFIAILAIFLYLIPELKDVRFKIHFEIHFNQIQRLYVFRKVNKRTQWSLTPGPASCKPQPSRDSIQAQGITRQPAVFRLALHI